MFDDVLLCCYVLGILATSRALGDFPLKSTVSDRLSLVSAEPEILTFDLAASLPSNNSANSANASVGSMPEFLILASDGVWDVFENEEACDLVRDRMRSTMAALSSSSSTSSQPGNDQQQQQISRSELLAQAAAAAARDLVTESYKRGSFDNCTAIVVNLM